MGPDPAWTPASPASRSGWTRPPSRDAAERERRLRQTFRRLRSKVDEADDPAAAFRAFVDEPDLEAFDY